VLATHGTPPGGTPDSHEGMRLENVIFSGEDEFRSKWDIEPLAAGGNIRLNFRNATTGLSFLTFNEGGLVEFSDKMRINASGLIEFSDRMRIQANGRVGIGTPSPDAKLEINAGGETGLIVDHRPASPAGTRGIIVETNNLQNVAISVENTGAAAGSRETFLVTGGGNVFCTEVRVKAPPFGIGDYVFDNDYDLWSLPKLEKYVNKNHHLPGIPSAKEVAENDNVINVSELLANHLVKIEELTLYIIEQDKRIKKLEKKYNSNIKSK